jgi:hypothetical protein
LAGARGRESGGRSLVDSSQAAVKRQVLRQTAQHPSVLYTGLVGALGLAGTLILGPGLLTVGAALVGTLGAAAVWGANYSLGRERFAQRYIHQAMEQLERQRKVQAKDIRAALEETGSDEGTRQFARLGDKFAAFRRMLGERLSPGELTHARYLGTEQVYLSALDNLGAIAALLRSAGAIDEAYVRERTRVLQGQGDAHSRRELQALEERLALRRTQLDRVADLLARNEEAMTQMDAATAEIAAMRTGAKQASVDMETAMNELARLARRAKDY